MKKLTILAILTFLFVNTAFAQVPGYVPTNGLVGWWPFTGNANDESGNGNNGVVSNATLTVDRFGSQNSAYYFNGNSKIQCSIPLSLAPASSNAYSFSLWFNTNINGTSKMLLAYKGGQNQPSVSNYDIVSSHSNCSNNTVAVQNYPFNNPSACSPTTVGTGEWIHLVVVVNQVSDSFFVYKNNQFWFKGVTGNNSPVEGYLTFGNNFINQFGYNGSLDDIGVWNRALTANEISDLYAGPICYQYITVTDTLIINTNMTGYNPVTYENTIKIWPNPTNDHITIDCGNFQTLDGYQIRISNVLGQQFFQAAVNQQQFFVDMRNWSGNGVYFVNIVNPQGVTIDTRKIVLR